MRLPWFTKSQFGRFRRSRRRRAATPLLVRQLERRRVLDAAIQSLVVTPVLENAVASPTATDVDRLLFDWSLAEDAAEDASIDYTAAPPASGSAAAAAAADELPTNVPPVLVVAIDQIIKEGELLNLSGVNAPPLGLFIDDGGPDSHMVTVNWGDGTDTQEAMYHFADGSGAIVGMHTFAQDGIYEVIVSVTDEDGGNDTQSFCVTVKNVPPVLVVAIDQMLNEGALLDLSGQMGAPPLGLFADDGKLDTHTATIDWGDGSLVENAVIFPAMGSGALGGSHTYADDGLYKVKVRVEDNHGGLSEIQSFFVDVENLPPVLVVAIDQMLNEGALLDLSGQMGAPPLGLFADDGKLDTHTATIDWGDGSLVENAVIFPAMGSGALGGSHTYADDGLYEVKVRVEDDDGGLSEIQSFLVTVANVDPTLIGTSNRVVDEGQVFTLAGLGVRISDPGFDNDNNVLDPSNGGEVAETFEVMQIDWGDGHMATATIANRQSPLGGPTTADFDHFNHAYADGGPNGTDFEVAVTLKDDDGGFVERTFSVHVRNVAPTLALTEASFVIHEGELLSIPNLGSFTDPGFTDATSGTAETFTYTIDWNDGAVDMLQMPASVTNGNRPTMSLQEMLTSGALSSQHFYADNDADNTYTITVTLSDDDGGMDMATLNIKVLNVNPALQPITATDVESTGRTTLNLSFADPGADSFQVLVDWGDKLHLPPEQRFVVETMHAGPTPKSFTLVHFYTGPPNPANPTADITINAKIADDDAAIAGVVEPGISNVETVSIANQGIQTNNSAIDTTPEVPRLEFTPPQPALVFIDPQVASTQGIQSRDSRVARSEFLVTSERFLELEVVSPDGTVISRHRIRDEALSDLRAFFATLPDNHYRIYLVRMDNNSRRLIMEVYVRGGRVIDPADDSEGTRDRPPTTEEAVNPDAVPLEENPFLQPVPAQEPNDAQEEPSAPNPQADAEPRPAVQAPDESLPPSIAVVPLKPSPRWMIPLAALGLAAGAGRWSQQIDSAFQQADDRNWQRLRRAGRLGHARGGNEQRNSSDRKFNKT